MATTRVLPGVPQTGGGGAWGGPQIVPAQPLNWGTAPVPPGMVGSNQTKAPAINIASSFQNIIRTGSAAPAPTQQPADLGVGSPTNPKGVGGFDTTAGAGGAGAGGAGATANADASITMANQPSSIFQPQTTPASRVPGLRSQGDQVRSEAFQAVYGYTPDEWQNLDPGAQRRLRNQRVQGLAGQLGNINSAIQTAKEEEAAAKSDAQKERETAVDQLNTYLKYGVFDSLSEEERGALAQSTGLNPKALAKIAEQANAGEPPELRSVGGDLYSLTYDSKTGKWNSELVQGKGGGGGSGSGGGGGGSYTAASSGETKEVQLLDYDTREVIGTTTVPKSYAFSTALNRPAGLEGNKEDTIVSADGSPIPKEAAPTENDLFMQYVESVGLKKVTEKERKKYLSLKSGGTGVADDGDALAAAILAEVGSE